MQGGTYTEGQPREDAAGRRQLTSPGERPQEQLRHVKNFYNLIKKKLKSEQETHDLSKKKWTAHKHVK